MELEDLKQHWETNRQNPVPQQDLQQILRKAKDGPLQALKKNFLKQIMLLCFIFLLLVYRLKDRSLLHNSFFWWYAIFCSTLCVFFFFNYRLVKKMEKMDAPVAAHLSSQVELLENRMCWHRTFTRIAVVSLIVIAETFPFFINDALLLKWHTVSVWIRVGVYVLLILFQHFVGKLRTRRRYGQHLDRLKNLLTATG